MEQKILISIISPSFNEQENIEELYTRVFNVFEALPEFEFEYVFIDNASEDRTQEVLRKLASKDPRVKVIINTRNFGHIRSPYWGIINTKGAATIYLASVPSEKNHPRLPQALPDRNPDNIFPKRKAACLPCPTS